MPAPLEELPVFVRAGAVVPSSGVVQSTAEYSPEEITLDLYLPVRDGEWVSRLQEDDGLTGRWREGEFLRTEFRLTREGGRVTLRGTVSGNGYPGFRRTAFRVRVIGNTVAETVIANSGEDFSLEIG